MAAKQTLNLGLTIQTSEKEILLIKKKSMTEHFNMEKE